MTDISDILGTTSKLCVSCGTTIPPERIADMPEATKCLKCQSTQEDNEEGVVYSNIATGKTERALGSMSVRVHKATRRPGYGSNLKFDRKI